MSVQCVSLRDEETGTRADILVGFGLNCFRFQSQREGRPVEVIWSEEGFETGERRPSGSGIPILFPFPGRIRGTQFLWEGQAYSLPPDDGRGNAIHGFVHRRPWRIRDQSPQHLTAQFHARSDALNCVGSGRQIFSLRSPTESLAADCRRSFWSRTPD